MDHAYAELRGDSRVIDSDLFALTRILPLVGASSPYCIFMRLAQITVDIGVGYVASRVYLCYALHLNEAGCHIELSSTCIVRSRHFASLFCMPKAWSQVCYLKTVSTLVSPLAMLFSAPSVVLGKSYTPLPDAEHLCLPELQFAIYTELQCSVHRHVCVASSGGLSFRTTGPGLNRLLLRNASSLLLLRHPVAHVLSEHVDAGIH